MWVFNSPCLYYSNLAHLQISSFDQQLSLTEQRFSPVWSESQFSPTQLLIASWFLWACYFLLSLLIGQMIQPRSKPAKGGRPALSALYLLSGFPAMFTLCKSWKNKYLQLLMDNYFSVLKKKTFPISFSSQFWPPGFQGLPLSSWN